MKIKIDTNSEAISLAVIKALVKSRNLSIDKIENYKLSVGLEFADTEIDLVAPVIKLVGEMDEIKIARKQP